ncbi:MAG: polyhydroxyalkanoate depolymerase [Granulosicoccus sp.]
MKYHTYQLMRSALMPLRVQSHLVRQSLEFPSLWPDSHAKRLIRASCTMFENMTRRYGKPAWDIDSTRIWGMDVPVTEEVVMKRTWCNLLHFNRDETVCGKRYDPKVLIIAPMSGHYATLLRGTVKAMLPEHNLYITDWRDARDVPAAMGTFGLDDFVTEIIECIRWIGHDVHVIAVCQPAVAAVAGTAVMAAMDDECTPVSLTLMGGPLDTRKNPTAVNELAESKPLDWFKNNVIQRVPWPNAGVWRRVYPGFIQLSGFMQMNLDKHMEAHRNVFKDLVKGDCDSVDQHNKFYDEYLAVMDLSAEFYLETVKRVFQEHALPKGTFTYKGKLIDTAAIRDTALMTIEGERDDICGLGQTEAAHDICPNIPVEKRWHYVQPGVGHYGVFNGTRWRTEIQPRIREMIRTVRFQRQTGSSPGRIYTAA